MHRNNSKMVYLCGNTVKLSAHFYDWEGNLVDITFPKLIIYDYNYNKIEEIILNENNHESTGVYSYDYITDSEPRKYIYEFKGELNGLPALNRDSFSTRFIW